MTNPTQLSAGALQELLSRARRTLQREIGNEIGPPEAVPSEELHSTGGAFLTLRTANGDLRGCIGRVHSDLPLWNLVDQLVVESARQDPRFPPVQFDEVKGLRIHLSILSALSSIPNSSEIHLGIHGIQVQSANRSGLFLPEVALQQGWDRDEFVRQACRKAEIPDSSLSAKEVQISIFTTQSHGEAQLDTS